MIPEKLDIDIVRSNSFKSSRSKIVATPHLKKLLRQGIYTNRIAACVRELTLNAFDSHVEAGCKERAIEITLPTIFEPTFKVRDFGIGLCDYGIREIMFSYGDPTGENVKSTSNEEHGMFHVGAKAPFSYTNAFTVIAIKDGVKRIYTAYIGEDEDDYIDQLGEELVSEENGVEVIIPVKPEDIDTFINEVKQFFRFWDIKPIIRGVSDFEWPVNKFKVLKDNWGFLESESFYYKTSYILLNGAPYKITSNSITNLTDVGRYILNNSVIIFAKIGDVSLASSREEVAYSDRTINFLKTFIDKIESEVKHDIEECLKTIKTEYDARKIYYDFFAVGGIHSGFFSEILKNAKYKIEFGQMPITTYAFPIKGMVFSFEIEHSDKNICGFKLTTEKRAKNIDIFPAMRNTDKLHKLYYLIHNPNIEPESQWASVKKKVKHLLGGGTIKHYDTDVHVFFFKDQNNFLSYVTEVGFPDGTFKNIESIVIPIQPKKPREKREYTARTENAHVYIDNSWSSINADLEKESGYYVTRYFNNYFLSADKSRNEDVESNFIDIAFTFLKNIQAMPKKIYAFTPSICNKLDKSKWKNLEDLVKEEFLKYCKSYDGQKIKLNDITSSKIVRKILEFVEIGLFIVKNRDPLKQILNQVEINSARCFIFPELKKYFGLPLENNRSIEIKDLKIKIDTEMAKYPLCDNYLFLGNDRYDEDFLIYLNAKYKQLEKTEKTAKENLDLKPAIS
jgi:hypothetical protein